MLHVLDGDATVPRFREAKLEGDAVVWREACYDGPWPRALRGLEDVIARVRRAEREKEEIVTWFDTDLFCRLNAACLVSVVPDAHITNAVGLHTERAPLRQLFETRVLLSPRFADVWRAYVGDDPRALLPFVDAFPWVKLHLARFPSAGNGLDLVEESILRQLRKDGVGAPAAMAARMRTSPTFAPESYGLTFEEVEQRIQELGPLLEGERDRAEVAPFDRHVGGVRVRSDAPHWRWDGVALSLHPGKP